MHHFFMNWVVLLKKDKQAILTVLIDARKNKKDSYLNAKTVDFMKIANFCGLRRVQFK